MIYLKEPVFVDSYSKFLRIKFQYVKGQKFQFNCVTCGKLTSKHGQYVVDDLYCKVCNQKRKLIEKYGVDHVSKLPDFREKVRKAYYRKSKMDLSKINQKRIETCKAK